MKKIDKPWGCEEILIDNQYLVKRLILEDETSLHYHTVRNEILIPVVGSGHVELEGKILPLGHLVPVYISRGEKHKIVPNQYLEIIEISDRNVDDVVRIADKHKRV